MNKLTHYIVSYIAPDIDDNIEIRIVAAAKPTDAIHIALGEHSANPPGPLFNSVEEATKYYSDNEIFIGVRALTINTKMVV